MGEGIVITYETLFDLLRREKSREELQVLDQDFYVQVTEYLKEKNELLISHGEIDESEKIRIQIANIKKILKELYERRERKIVNLAMYKSRLSTALIDTRSLLPEEKLLLDSLVQEMSRHREQVLNTVINQKKPHITAFTNAEYQTFHEHAPLQHATIQQATIPHSTDEESHSQEAAVLEKPKEITKMVRFITAVPKFLGTELEIYGPFEEDDMASLPEKIASILIQKGRAEEIAK